MQEKQWEELKFSDLEFEQTDEKVKVTFLKSFGFEIENQLLSRIGAFEAAKNTISFESRGARNKFNLVLDNGLKNLKHKITKKPAFYIHRYSGIPLIGNNAFGIIDRNTNIIEVKPVTGCNQNCLFCSVDEGLSSKKTTEIVVEKDYLKEEFEKIAKFKGCEIEAYINSHGEPTSYGPLPELIKDLKAIENVSGVVMNSNGSLLDEEHIDRLAQAGLKRLNLSLNAIEPKKAKMLSGWGLYDVEKIKRTAKYASEKIQVLIAPVWVPGLNDDEIPKIIKFTMELGARIGIQNYLFYKRGRNPVKPESWERFYEKLKKLEEEFGINLTKMDLKGEFNIKPTIALPKPFKKGQVIQAEIVCQGRYPNEKLAVAGGRNITIIGSEKETGPVRAKIIRSKHNIFSAVAI